MKLWGNRIGDREKSHGQGVETTMYEHYWHERTIEGVRYQFEAQVDEHLWRVNLHQQNHNGTWATLFGAWYDLPGAYTPQEALVAFADRWEAVTKMREVV